MPERRWKPPKYAPHRRLQVTNPNKQYVNRMLNGIIVALKKQSHRPFNTATRLWWREETVDDFVGDLIFRTTDLVEACRGRGCGAAEFMKMRIAVALLHRIGVIDDDELNTILQDMGGME